ncbi:MAG TPA: hypothetical protein VIM98_10535 [Dyella sp.]|uniref:hypothetical protein n=1 Tax=Dyella sp. TaxID=1869338 RepID=UPI002F955603
MGIPSVGGKTKPVASHLASIGHATDDRATDRTAISSEGALLGIGADYRLPRLTVLSILGRMQDTLSHMPCSSKRAHYVDRFCGALAARSMNEPLDARESKALAALMRSVRQRLPKGRLSDFTVDGGHRVDGAQLICDVCEAMRAFSKAAAMRIKLEETAAQWEAKHSSLGLPGSSHVKQSALSLGLGGGLSGVAKIGGGVRWGATKIVTADDAINVLSMHERAGRLYGKATAGIGDMLGVSGEGWVEYAKAPAKDLGLIEDVAARVTEKKLNRTSGLQQLRNAWRGLIGSRARASTYDQILRRANAYRDKLPMLVSPWGIRLQPMSRELPSELSQVPLRAVVNQWRSNVTGAASAGVIAASASASRQKTEVRAALLTPISTYLEGGHVETPVDLRRVEAIVRRGERLLGSNPATAPLSRLLETHGKPLSVATALARLEAEVEHYEQVARYSGVSRKAVRDIEASFLKSWKAATREEAMVHMLAAHAWLRVNPQGLASGSDDDRLATDFDRVARKIYEMDIGHDRDHVRTNSSVADRFMQEIQTSSLHLRVGAGIDAIGASVGMGVHQSHRRDPNPLRAGEYLNIEVSFSLVSQLNQLAAAIVDAVKPVLPEASLASDLSNLLGQGLSHLSADVTAGGRLLIRFFKPAYQSEAAFPDEAKGYRLQTAILYRERSMGIGPMISLPVAPGLMIDAGVSTGVAQSDAVREHFGDNCLSGPLNRYMRLKGSKDPLASWAAFILAQPKSLHNLMGRMGDPTSAVHHEARYWDGLRGEKGEHPIFEQMKAFRTGRAIDDRQACEQLTAFFGDLYDAFTQKQFASELITPVDLPVSPKPGWAMHAVERPLRVTRL